MSLYVIIKPGTSEILGDNYSKNTEDLGPEAAILGGVISSLFFLKRKYNVRTPSPHKPLTELKKAVARG